MATDILSRENLLKRRWAAAIVLAILATVGMVATVASRWTHDVIFDTDTFMATVGPAGTSPEVTDTLTTYVSGELVNWVDAQDRLENLLPDRLAPVAGLLAPLLNNLIVEETGRFFQSDVYERLWLGITERAHRAAVAIIRDQVPFVTTADGTVTIDLVPMLQPITDRFFDRLSQLGNALDTLSERLNLGDTLGDIVTTYEQEGLPDRLSNIEVYSSDRLAALQQWTSVLDKLVWILPVLTILFAAGAIYLAPRRWWMVVGLLGAAAIGWVLAGWAVNTIVSSVIAGISSATAATVAGELFRGVTDGLRDLLIILGVIAALASLVVLGWGYHTEKTTGSVEPTEPGESPAS